MYYFQLGDDRIGTHNMHTHITSRASGHSKQMNGILCVICSNRRLLTINGCLVCFVFFKKILQFIDVAFCHSIFTYLRFASSAFFSLMEPHSRVLSSSHRRIRTHYSSYPMRCWGDTHTHTLTATQKFHIESLKTNTRHTDLCLSFIL